MRAIIFILIIFVVIIVVAIASGFLDINQIRGARAPQVTATGNGLTATGGQAPAFDVETGSVKVGTTKTTVNVPTLTVRKPEQNRPAAAPSNAEQ